MNGLIIATVVLFIGTALLMIAMNRISHGEETIERHWFVLWPALFSTAFALFGRLFDHSPGLYAAGVAGTLAAGGLVARYKPPERMPAVFLSVYLGMWFSVPYAIARYFAG